MPTTYDSTAPVIVVTPDGPITSYREAWKDGDRPVWTWRTDGPVPHDFGTVANAEAFVGSLVSADPRVADELSIERGEAHPDPEQKRVERAVRQYQETTGRAPSPYDIAMALTDEDVAKGEYEGCSTELELAASDYIARAERVL